MKPSAPISRRISGGILPCSSISAARGRTFSLAKSRADRWASSCSSERARSKPVSAVAVATTRARPRARPLPRRQGRARRYPASWNAPSARRAASPEDARPTHRRDDDGGAAVVELRRVARGDRPAGLERGLKLREPVQAGFAGRLVRVHDRDGALSPRDLDGNDLRIERALALRAERL